MRPKNNYLARKAYLEVDEEYSLEMVVKKWLMIFVKGIM